MSEWTIYPLTHTVRKMVSCQQSKHRCYAIHMVWWQVTFPGKETGNLLLVRLKISNHTFPPPTSEVLSWKKYLLIPKHFGADISHLYVAFNIPSVPPPCDKMLLANTVPLETGMSWSSFLWEQLGGLLLWSVQSPWGFITVGDDQFHSTTCQPPEGWQLLGAVSEKPESVSSWWC